MKFTVNWTRSSQINYWLIVINTYDPLSYGNLKFYLLDGKIYNSPEIRHFRSKDLFHRHLTELTRHARVWDRQPANLVPALVELAVQWDRHCCVGALILKGSWKLFGIVHWIQIRISYVFILLGESSALGSV